MHKIIFVIPFFPFQDPRDLIKEGKEDIDKETFHDMVRDPRSFLANLPPLPALEAFNRRRDFLSNPQSLLASLRPPSGSLLPTMPPTSLPQHLPAFGTPPLSLARPPSQPPTPSSQSSSPVQQNFGSQQNWSYEEQFKQVG